MFFHILMHCAIHLDNIIPRENIAIDVPLKREVRTGLTKEGHVNSI